jgi:HlyD family secretion protein
MKPSTKQLLTHPITLASIAAVVVIAFASAFYYSSATRVPVVNDSVTDASSTAMLTGSGTVEPSENPDLTFAAGGRVTSVSAVVGHTVYSGQVLASLDTSALYAQRAQAVANVQAAQARLAQLQAPARTQDVAAKQTAVAQANTALSNLYMSVATGILQSYDRSFSSLSQNTDSLFNQANSSNPSFVFYTYTSTASSLAVSSRVAALSELSTWQSETSALSSASAPDQIDAALKASIAHLQILRAYGDAVLSALTSAIPSNGSSQASISAAQISAASYRDSINSLISTLQSNQQQILSARLAIQSATDALGQVTAGATPEEIAAQNAAIAAAQASVQTIDAQIRNEVIVAPFSGTVASVNIKQGDIAAANTPAISLNPESALQIVVYFSEIDVTKIHVGDSARVTLDAYGNDRSFDAHVVSIDSAPSSAGPDRGYKATLQFLKSDPAITSGMTANITIPLTK